MSRIFLLLIFGVPFYFSDGQSRARGRSVGGSSNRDEMGRETALPVNLVRVVVGGSALGGRTFFSPIRHANCSELRRRRSLRRGERPRESTESA